MCSQQEGGKPLPRRKRRLYPDREEQLRRIGYYEELMRKARETLSRTDVTGRELASLGETIRALSAYYGSPVWKKDFADDEAGLLPEGVMRATKTAAQFQNLEKDAEVELEIQRVDPAARRITLAPKGVEMPAPKEKEASSGKPERKGGRPGREPEDNSWRQHQKSGSSNNSVMFQALQEALKAKKN